VSHPHHRAAAEAQAVGPPDQSIAATELKPRPGTRHITTDEDINAMSTDNLESIYQKAIANVPRSKEKDNGFLEKDLIREMIKRMTTGTDREKRLAAATLIDHKTKEGTNPQKGFLNVGDGTKPYPYEPERLMRWDDWLIEWKNMTLPWVEEQSRQGDEEMQKAEA
jgi:hypothetical protein